MWLDRVKHEYDKELNIRWKHFQLDQVNSKRDPDWNVWEQADHRESRSLVAAMASESVRRNEPGLFDAFHLELLTARHGGNGRIALNREEPILELAKQVGLNTELLARDLEDRGLLEAVGRDHIEAVAEHGAFGTPTFIFERGTAVYLKAFIPPEEESVSFFEEFVSMMGGRSYVGELKRPQPPWPKGAVGRSESR